MVQKLLRSRENLIEMSYCYYHLHLAIDLITNDRCSNSEMVQAVTLAFCSIH